jgi:steroid delta-isomerase-like uncharacterized protein
MIEAKWISHTARLALLQLSALVLIGCGGQAVSSPSPPPTGGQLASFGQGWCDAWNSRSVDEVVAVFTNDVYYEDVPFGLTVHGSAQLRGFAQRFFAAVPDVHFDCTATALNGGHGDIEWIWSGTDVGLFNTGKRFSVRGTAIIDVQKNKISRNSDYYDLATIMRQVGILPTS